MKKSIHLLLFCHSDPERIEKEESPQETLRLTPQGDIMV